MNLSNLRLSKKVIFIFIGIVVVAELAWAGLTLTRNSSNAATQKTGSSVQGGSVISLKADKESVKVGENVTVEISVTSNKATDGADMVIIYDPRVLSLVPGSAGAPVSVGLLYSDYPLNKADETLGRIMVSGITSRPGGILPQGVFGTVTFRANQAGRASISLDFTPGSTTDSNIIETKTARDLLDGVNNAEVVISK